MFDLAIIGAGVIGATSFYLARQKKPEWRILLVDRSLIGKGASAYSAGLDFPYGRTAWHKQLSIESGKMYGEFRKQIPNLPIHCLPFVGIVKKQNLEQVLTRFTCNSVHTAAASEREMVLSKLPGLIVDHDQELLVGGRGAIGFVDKLVSALTGGASSPRSQCWEGVAISQITAAQNGGHILNTMDGRQIEAQRVLVATGPWLLNGPGSEDSKAAGVRIKKVAALHILRQPPHEFPILYFFNEDAFLLPVYGEKWILSFTSREWDCVPDASSLNIKPEERNGALSILERYYPSLVPDCSGGRVFCDAYSPDWAPYISSPQKNMVIAGACSGAGFRIAPAIAQTALQHFSGFNNPDEV